MRDLKVGSDLPSSSHDMMLDDGSVQYYFNLADLTIDQQPNTPNNLFQTGGNGGQFGRFTADHAHLLQRDWGGGRAQYDWEDNTKYLDAREAWTLIPGKITPTGRHMYQVGAGDGGEDPFIGGSPVYSTLPGALEYDSGNSKNVRIPDDMEMVKLTSQDKYALQLLNPTVEMYVGSIYLYLRQVGIPKSTLTVEVCDNNAGSPGTVRWTGTVGGVDATIQKTTRSAQPYIDLREFRAAQYTITADADPWIVIYGSGAGDDIHNHWEVGCVEGGQRQGRYDSASGGSWDNTDKQICYLATYKERNAGDREIWNFEYEGALYGVRRKLDGSASVLFINGDRGVADASSVTTVVDATKTWDVDMYVGATVRIVGGVGKGQVGVITANTANTITVRSDSDWHTAPDTTSEYVIRGSDVWLPVTLAGDAIPDMVTDIEVVNETVYFAFGSTGSNMWRMRWNSAAHTGRNDAKKSDFLTVHQDDTGKIRLWCGQNSATTTLVEHRALVDWGTSLGTGTDVTCGDSSSKITGMLSHEGRLWVFKEDKPYYLSQTYLLPVEVGLKAMYDQNNGKNAVAWKRDIYFPWAYSVEKMRGVTVDDMGPWKGSGLPEDRRGKINSILPIHAFMLMAIDAGTRRTSSVLYHNEIGYGELYRAPVVGHRIRNIFWDSVPGGNDRVLIDVGDFMQVAIEFPDDTLNFLEDSTFKYHHQWAMTSSTFDMEAQQLSKLFKALTLTTQNLDYITKIHAQYQVDGKVGTDEWQSIGDFTESPHESRPIDEGRRKKIRYRLIGTTADASVPPIVEAAVLEGFARTPIKYSYPLAISTKNLTSSEEGVRTNPDTFVSWLIDNSQQGGELTLHTSPGFALMDGLDVIVFPPNILRQYRNRKDGKWDGTVRVVVRDA